MFQPEVGDMITQRVQEVIAAVMLPFRQRARLRHEILVSDPKPPEEARSAAALSAATSSSAGGFCRGFSGTAFKYCPVSTGESTSMVKDTGAKWRSFSAALTMFREVAYFHPSGIFKLAENVMSSDFHPLDRAAAGSS